MKIKALFFIFVITTITFAQEANVTLEYEGDVSLYKNVRYDNYGNRINTYFVKRDGQNMVKIFPVGVLGNGSDKAMKNILLIARRAFEMYFADKPNLNKNEKFKNRLIEIVKYYNTKCDE